LHSPPKYGAEIGNNSLPEAGRQMHGSRSIGLQCDFAKFRTISQLKLDDNEPSSKLSGFEYVHLKRLDVESSMTSFKETSIPSIFVFSGTLCR
jgi:hypothetical protein